MAEGRAGWSAGLILVGLGAAVFTGAGVAVADTEGSDSAGSSNGSAANDSSRPANESSSRSVSDADETDASTDPATVPSFSNRSNVDSPDTDVSGTGSSFVTSGTEDDAADESAVAEDAAEDIADGVADDVASVEDTDASGDTAGTEETTGSSSEQGDSAAAAAVEPVAPRTSSGNAEFRERTDAFETTSPAAAVAFTDEADATSGMDAELVTPSLEGSPAAAPAAVLAEAETTATPAPASVPSLVADADFATIQTSAGIDSPSPLLGPVATAVLNLLSVFGWAARPDAVEAFPALAPWATTTSAPLVPVAATPSPAAAVAATPLLGAAIAADPSTVTGVKTGHAKLDIPVGPHGYTTLADWYLPTQADGSVSATGVIWLQHGFLNVNFFVSALAATLAQQTNSIVVAPYVDSFPWRCSGCWLNGEPMQEAVASMFLADRAALNTSATAAGFQGVLPEDFVLSGQSAGGGFATSVAGYYATDLGSDDSLRGVVMFDGFSFGGVVPAALEKLDDPFIPVYQVAAPPQLWNLFGSTTKELVAARPGEFVGATLAGGSHADAILGGNPLVDFFAQLVTKFSPPGNTTATHTLATGWINDMYQGLGPIDGNGIYGFPSQYIVMGDTAAIVLAPAPIVELDRYLGTWYEVGSVKQFFSLGLVNTTAVYSPNPDGSIKVENSGNYFFDNGPESTIVGSALPVDADKNKLNVSFLFPANANPPGNYWIVDLSPGYSELDPDGWAIVSDPSGFTGFLLSRSPIVSDELYQELLDRASVQGIWGWITRTRQFVSAPAVAA